MENKDRPYQSKEEFEQHTTKRETSDEMDLTEFLARLWGRRKFISIVIGISLCIGVFIAFASPTRYTAECVIFPQSSKQGNSNALSGVASMMGINLGTTGMESGGLPPSVYPQILSSWPFIKDIMNTPITVEKSGGKSITLYDYYTDERYKEVNILASIKEYTIGLPGMLLSALRDSESDSLSSVNSLSDSIDIIKLSRQNQRVYNTISSSILFEFDKKEGIITLAYIFPESLAAAQITQHLHQTLERYVINYKTQKVRENLIFVEKSYATARKDFLQKQANLASYQDANRSLITATGRSIENRLRSEYDIAFTVYSELAKQREQALLALKEEKPILTLLKPVIVPLEKSEPRKGFIIINFLLIGAILSTSWILLEPYIKELKEKSGIKNKDTR